ncbi:MAG: hypothetical protein PX481_17630 [Microcystis sp. M53603_WE2]|uniref:hypothetical protein n=1 Tax=unclassified Microcystis TaxID=2643300 RepID=UPI0022C91B34|nr:MULTISPECIES: hypothetical protein [unclassified Microcystis]MCZ8026498.1 hypothetical protein [Microcystis sp. LE19-10.1B]MCZ8362565.1 hypothetical protein [Microcystis sp. LE19-251.1A]MDJ0540462.1 hypothetical protein [Microcystis sp. M53603_WE2]MDJ0604942.1 hypothetical protein [Microcystis sp. M53602_WE12]
MGGALHLINAPYAIADRTDSRLTLILPIVATSQKPLRGKMKATTASLASQPIACGC